MRLKCVECGSSYPMEPIQVRCGCGGLLEVEQDLALVDAELLKRRFQERLSERMGVYASGVWRYKELIFPELPDEYIVTK